MFAILQLTSHGGHPTRSRRAHRVGCSSSKLPDLYCQFCQRRFKQGYNLMVHERSHYEPLFGCDICGKTFKKQENLRVHRSLHSPSSSGSSSPNSYY